jgi:hypothetical protein
MNATGHKNSENTSALERSGTHTGGIHTNSYPTPHYDLHTVSTVSSSLLSTPCSSENPTAKKCSAIAFLALGATDNKSYEGSLPTTGEGKKETSRFSTCKLFCFSATSVVVDTRLRSCRLGWGKVRIVECVRQPCWNEMEGGECEETVLHLDDIRINIRRRSLRGHKPIFPKRQIDVIFPHHI